MTTHTGIGFSQNTDISVAAKEAAQQAKEQLDQDRTDLILFFYTIHYDPQICLPIIYKILNQVKIFGTSTAGIILSDRIETQGIGIMAVSSEDIKFETSYVTNLNPQDMREAGRTLAKNSMTASGQQHRKLFVFLIDGLLRDPSSLVEGIKEQFGSAFSIVGAGSSEKEPLTKSAAGLLLSGRLHAGMSCKHGWKPLGKPRTANRVEGHIIKLIDGKKATDIYQEYFDEEAKTLKTGILGHINVRYPLGIRVDGHKEYLLRNVIETTDDGSLVCKGNIAEGAQVHIMIESQDSCLRAAQEAAVEAKAQLQGKPPKLIIIFESFLRQKLLGKSILKELLLIKNVFGDTPLIGMYSYGETFSATSSENILQTRIQNGSIVILAVS